MVCPEGTREEFLEGAALRGTLTPPSALAPEQRPGEKCFCLLSFPACP